jgi:hypothetical protein
MEISTFIDRGCHIGHRLARERRSPSLRQRRGLCPAFLANLDASLSAAARSEPCAQQPQGVLRLAVGQRVHEPMQTLLYRHMQIVRPTATC